MKEILVKIACAIGAIYIISMIFYPSYAEEINSNISFVLHDLWAKTKDLVLCGIAAFILFKVLTKK